MDREIVINGKKIKNRVLIQPMEGADGLLDGGLSELTIRRYHRFAKSGAGIIWFEAVAVCSEGRANPHQLYLTEENMSQYKKLVEEIKAISKQKFGFEPIIIIQLTHSGRQSSPIDKFAPLVAFRSDFLEKGKENLDYTVVSDEYLDSVSKMYAKSAKLASAAGFDGVDVKCCHGYLFDELLGAHNREGRYGSTFEGRTKLFFDCVDSVKNAVQDMIITSRINASDCYPYPNGYGVDKNNQIDLSECKKILNILANKGVEMVNISLGNPYLIPHINRPCTGAAESIETGLKRIKDIMVELSKDSPVALVMSGLTALKDKALDYGKQMLDEGVCDFIGYGRMAFAYPDFYTDYLANGKLDKSKCCIMCSNCTKLMRSGTVSGCPIRDGEVYMPYFQKYVEGKK